MMRPNASVSLRTLFSFLILSLLSTAHAALELDFVTTRGTVTVQLEYDKVPRSVANVLTLAQGTRSWIDPVNGAVRREPFYDGLSFSGVRNTSSEKHVEMGATALHATMDAGFNIPDEFHASLVHAPYVVALSNDGPNSSGARLRFIGSAVPGGQDGRRTIIGKIPAGTSRTVVDAIIAAGSGATTVQSLQVRKTDPAAVAFNEHGVALPIAMAVNGPLQIAPGSVRLSFPQPPDSVLKITSSTNLQSWESRFHSFTALDGPAAASSPVIDNRGLPSCFYHIALAAYPATPQAGGPVDFKNRRLTIVGPGVSRITYQFDTTGMAGTYENILDGDVSPIFSGPFQVRQDLPFIVTPYSFQMLIHVPNLGGSPFNLVRGGVDSVGTSSLSGRHETVLMNSSMGHVFTDHGAMDLTRP